MGFACSTRRALLWGIERMFSRRLDFDVGSTVGIYRIYNTLSNKIIYLVLNISMFV